MRIADSELVLNADGSVYHLQLHPEQIARNILLVGDPGRVKMVSGYFEKVEHKVQHREFLTHTGWFGGQRISVVSTGIGTDNIDIVLNELDSLVNIDLKARTVLPEHTQLNFIRVGTSGSLQGDIPVNSLVVSAGALGLDSLLHFYNYENNDFEKEFLTAFNGSSGLSFPGKPYFFEAEKSFLKYLSEEFIRGITATCAGFYAPQGRQLRAKAVMPDLLKSLAAFRFENQRITNFEMETSGIYGLSRILGHRALSFNVILANRPNGKFSRDPRQSVNFLIEKVLENLSLLEA